MPADNEVTAPEVNRRVDGLEGRMLAGIEDLKRLIRDIRDQFVTQHEHRALAEDVAEIKAEGTRTKDRQRQLVMWVIASLVVPVLLVPCVGVIAAVVAGVATYLLTHP